MEDLIKQVFLFLSVYILNKKFKFFFVLIDIAPVFMYFLFDFGAESLISYYIMEVIIYCLIHILIIRTIDFPLGISKVFLSIISIVLIFLSSILIPHWNAHAESPERISFWNYVSVLFVFHTISFLAIKNDSFDLEEGILKNRVVFKFLALIIVVSISYILTKYINIDIAIISVVVATRILLDLAVLRRLKSFDN